MDVKERNVHGNRNEHVKAIQEKPFKGFQLLDYWFSLVSIFSFIFLGIFILISNDVPKDKELL